MCKHNLATLDMSDSSPVLGSHNTHVMYHGADVLNGVQLKQPANRLGASCRLGYSCAAVFYDGLPWTQSKMVTVSMCQMAM